MPEVKEMFDIVLFGDDGSEVQRRLVTWHQR